MGVSPALDSGRATSPSDSGRDAVQPARRTQATHNYACWRRSRSPRIRPVRFPVHLSALVDRSEVLLAAADRPMEWRCRAAGLRSIRCPRSDLQLSRASVLIPGSSAQRVCKSLPSAAGICSSAAARKAAERPRPGAPPPAARPIRSRRRLTRADIHPRRHRYQRSAMPRLTVAPFWTSP